MGDRTIPNSARSNNKISKILRCIIRLPRRTDERQKKILVIGEKHMKTQLDTSDYTKHFVYQDIGMIMGYTIANETIESEFTIINTIKIKINLSSGTGAELYNALKGKLKPNDKDYLYSEYQNSDILTIEIKIVTNKNNPEEIKLKKKLLQKINKYT